MWSYLIGSLLLNLLVINITAALSNPYSILGVPHTASVPEIKKAYKNLVKEWHPDKNSSPDAQDKFLKISEAYKLLSNADRREYFDSTGRTDPEPNFSNFHSNIFRHHQSAFDELFGFSQYHEKAQNFYKQQSITLEEYEKEILPESERKGFVLLFYSSRCGPCNRLFPIWERLWEELVPSNMGIQTVNAQTEEKLATKLGVKTVPYIVVLLDMHPYHYTQATISIASLFDFIKSKFPHNLVQRVSQSNIQPFLNGWIDNKVRVLLFGRLDIIRIRYLALAWQFRNHTVVGYVQIGLHETESIRSRYGIGSKGDTLLVFHEDSNPVSSITTVDLPYDTMKAIVEANKFLMLPRLSCQANFDALCPVETIYSRRHLCVVLVTRNAEEHDASRNALRKYAQTQKTPRLTYTYIYKEKQTRLIQALTNSPDAPKISDLHIVVIWRNDAKHIRYQWVKDQWSIEADVHNRSKQSLRQVIEGLLYNNEAMPYETEIQELFDENAHNLFWRVINKLSKMYSYIQDKITSEDIITASSVIATIIFIIFAGYFMSFLVQLEEQKLQSEGVLSGSERSQRSSPQLKIHELRAETYFGLVRFLKPGCRTIVLLCDADTKVNLIKKFHKCCWPYRKNKTLMFAFLNIDRTSSMQWYKQILSLGLSTPQELKINPKNTVGTVLSLNGHRKYYCIYHAKHPEDIRNESGFVGNFTNSELRRRHGARNGFGGSSDSESGTESDLEAGSHRRISISSEKPLLNYYSDVLFEDQLLDGLSNWLDRLFEGTTHRYPINFWPDWP